jgi:hypothetical protein
MKEKRFKVRDNVTYKSRVNCTSQYGSLDSYYYGGTDHDGFVGKIVGYNGFNEERGCWCLNVSTKYDHSYIMLESEFKEYDYIKPSIEEGKYYINLEGTIIVKATGQKYDSTFSAVCIESTNIRFKPDYYSTGWLTDNFKEHDYIKSSNDLFPIF